MSAQHAIRHNLAQYKKQAKDLLKAYQSADPAANALVRKHLPRLSNAIDARSEIALKEAQHVIARQQGVLREEMSFLEEPSAERVEEAQRRLLLNAANLALQGQLEWPECRTAPPREDGDPTATFTPPKQIMVALEKQFYEELASAAVRYRATIAGALAVQSGMDAQETERHVREEVMRG